MDTALCEIPTAVATSLSVTLARLPAVRPAPEGPSPGTVSVTRHTPFPPRAHAQQEGGPIDCFNVSAPRTLGEAGKGVKRSDDIFQGVFAVCGRVDGACGAP